LETYCDGRAGAPAAELQALREAWEQAGKRRQVELNGALASPETTQALGELTAFVQAPPVRRSKSTSLRFAAPVLLDELCADVAEREERVIADQPESYLRYQQSLARLACAVEALRDARMGPGDDLSRLAADLQRLEGRIDRWLASNALN